MATYGYARVSSADQDLTIQREKLAAAGCSIIRAEKVSGTKLAGRDELAILLDFVRPGDELVVTKIDRLARSLGDLQNIVFDLKTRGVALRATDQPIDTGSAAGAAFLGMLGVFAEFETSIRRDRQLEGVAKAKARGVYRGRVPTARRQSAEVLRLRAEGMSPSAIAKAIGISRASAYRIVGSVTAEAAD